MQFDRGLNTIKKAKQRGLIPLLCFVCWCFARVFLNTFRFSFFLRFVFQRHDFSIFRLYRDILRDSALDFAKRVGRCGVPVRSETLPGSVHLFITVPGQPAARAAAVARTRSFLLD